jgi:hypothetical protein
MNSVGQAPTPSPFWEGAALYDQVKHLSSTSTLNLYSIKSKAD